MTDINPTPTTADESIADTTTDRVDALYRSVVVDQSNEKVGPVGQVYLDDETSEPTWITVNTGFLGLQENFVPMDEAVCEGEIIRVPFDKDFIKGAPSIDPDGHIEETDEAELRAYYGKATEPTAVAADVPVDVSPIVPVAPSAGAAAPVAEGITPVETEPATDETEAVPAAEETTDAETVLARLENETDVEPSIAAELPEDDLNSRPIK